MSLRLGAEPLAAPEARSPETRTFNNSNRIGAGTGPHRALFGYGGGSGILTGFAAIAFLISSIARFN